MRIVASDLVLASASERTVERKHEERVLAWVGERPKGAARGLDDRPPADGARVSISAEARARAALEAITEASRSEAPPAGAAAATGAGATDEAESDPEDPRTLMMRLLVETLTVQRVRRGSIRIERARGDGGDPALAQRAAPRRGWGFEVDVRDTTREVQTVAFAARGTIETDDGRTIDLAASLSMRDERVTVTSVSIRAGDAAAVKDPLVLSFSGTPADLEGTVAFDFDADGADESMAMVGAGSGVLALDANGAARPGDGTQLFGARTGDGFAELAAYDEDRNGFIDEGDAVYQRLGVWTRDASGGESVRSLAEVGVGAISLAHAATTMDLRDDGGALAGRLQATGVYVAESGRVGVVQQIDVAVAEIPGEARRVDVVG